MGKTMLKSLQPMSRQGSRILSFLRDKRAVAAVEFALILPFMLLLYLGTAELTYGLMANRKMTMSARPVRPRGPDFCYDGYSRQRDQRYLHGGKKHHVAL